eukprot:scaffold5198_cov247-Pinguiococcus_pyrenoidosus.AAC.8
METLNNVRAWERTVLEHAFSRLVQSEGVAHAALKRKILEIVFCLASNGTSVSSEYGGVYGGEDAAARRPELLCLLFPAQSGAHGVSGCRGGRCGGARASVCQSAAPPALQLPQNAASAAPGAARRGQVAQSAGEGGAEGNLARKAREWPSRSPFPPQVFFSNERTFLAWLHMSVTLASISIAIVAFADHKGWSQVYGLLLLPVAIAFSVYSLFIYQRRAAMIRRRDPGPYEDRVGPILLGTILMVAIVLQFAVKVYDMTT